MVLAAYAPVVQRLRDAECGVVIVSTSSAAYAARFVSRLGFASPGTMVHDPKVRLGLGLALGLPLG